MWIEKSHPAGNLSPIFKCNFTESARGEDPTSAFELEMSKAAVT